MKIIKEKKRIKLGHLIETKGPSEMNPCSLKGRLAFPDFLDLSHFTHRIFLSSWTEGY
jgi:hypothetical protein